MSWKNLIKKREILKIDFTALDALEDCLNEHTILLQHLGRKLNLKDERDKLFKTTCWTILDIVIKECKFIMKEVFTK